MWNLFDFSIDLREEGDMVDVNDKGLLSYDRKTKKDAFYYYKAQWSTEPVVHITSGRHTERAADGQLFGSDNFFTGGEPRLLNGLSGGGFVAVKQARKTVEGTSDPTLFEGYRVGEFSYDIPRPNGQWDVTVRMAAGSHTPVGARLS